MVDPGDKLRGAFEGPKEAIVVRTGFCCPNTAVKIARTSPIIKQKKKANTRFLSANSFFCGWLLRIGLTMMV